MKKDIKKTSVGGTELSFAALSVTFLAVGIWVLANGYVTESIPAFVFAALLMALFMYFMEKNKQRLKAGVPKEDEMSRRINERAGYMAFLAVMIVCFFTGHGYLLVFGLFVFSLQYFCYSKGGLD